MRGGVEVADVVALDLEARAVVIARRQNVLDILERVLEHQVVAAFQIGAFPVVLEVLEALQQFIHAEVHRPHVQRRDFRLELRGRQHAFADRQHG
ncbi:hypothetical protein D3C78_1785830 [compost metagenome]